jgi:VTC domain
MSTYERRASLAAGQLRRPATAPTEPLAAANAPTYTNRYEIKYLLGADRLADVQAALQDYLRLDANGTENGGYYVHSIYFDSPDFQFLREKFEGQLTRVKPRIRSYRPSLDGPPSGIFLEMKGRYDRIVEKRRCPIDRPLAEVLLSETPVHPNGWSSMHSVLGEFQYLSHRFRLVPTVTVLYHRTAYFGSFWPNLRITFDRLLLCSPSTGLRTPSADFMQAMTCGQTVMELKYTDKVPRALLGCINGFGLQQRSFSKYAVSVERCFRGLSGNHSLH